MQNPARAVTTALSVPFGLLVPLPLALPLAFGLSGGKHSSPLTEAARPYRVMRSSPA